MMFAKKKMHHKRRIANCKSPSSSHAYKKQCIDELTTVNSKLRCCALVLFILPDPVVAISINGEIKYCSIQMRSMLKHYVEDLERANIDAIIVTCLRYKIWRYIQDLVKQDLWLKLSEGVSMTQRPKENIQSISMPYEIFLDAGKLCYDGCVA